jgi:hypothetical protein
MPKNDNKKNDKTYTKKEQNVKTGKNIMLGALFVFAVLGIGSVTNWWGFAPGTVVTPVVETDYKVTIVDGLDPTNTVSFEADITYAWYEKDLEGLSQGEIDALLLADFASCGAATNEMSPDTTTGTDFAYILKCSGTDIVERWFTTDSRLTFDQDSCPLDLLYLGDNIQPMCNETEDVSMTAHTTETGGITFAATTYRYWDIDLYMLDASESATAEMTNKEGYMSYFDVDTNLWTGLGIQIHLNETDAGAFTVINNYASVAEDVASDGSVHSYSMIHGLFSGVTTFQIRLALALTDATKDHAVPVSIEAVKLIGIDNAATPSTYDTQV